MKIIKSIITTIIIIIFFFLIDLSAVSIVAGGKMRDSSTAIHIVEQYTDRYDTEEIEISKLINMSPDTELFERLGINNKNAILNKSVIINIIDEYRVQFWGAFVISSIVSFLATIVVICINIKLTFD